MAHKFVITATPSGCEMEVRAEADTIQEAHKEAQEIKEANLDKADFQINIFRASDWKRWEESGFSAEEFTDEVAGYGSNSEAEWNEW